MRPVKISRKNTAYRTPQQPRRLPRRWLILVGTILFLLLASSIYAAYHERLLIKKIVIEGNKTVDDMSLEAVVEKEISGKYLFIYPKRNALIYPAERVVASVAAAFPRLATVKLAEDNFQTLRLSVSERKGEYLWCLADESCYFADDNGFVFAPAPRFSGHIYLEIATGAATDPIGKQVVPTSDFRRLTDFYQAFASVLASSTLARSIIYRAEPGDLSDWNFLVTMPESASGWRIQFDAEQDLTAALASARAVLADENFKQELADNHYQLEYLDLRFVPKVFYRFR